MHSQNKIALLFSLLRLAIGALFVYSGYTKLIAANSNFVGVVLSYQIVDVRMATWVAAILPWVEFIAGIFFILGIWFQASLFTLWVLSAVFLTAIASTLLRHIPLKDCGCFGEGAHGIPVEATLALDILLFFIFFWMYQKKEESGRFGLDRFLD